MTIFHFITQPSYFQGQLIIKKCHDYSFKDFSKLTQLKPPSTCKSLKSTLLEENSIDEAANFQNV